MRIGILFNVPRGTSKGEPKDFISEEGVLEEVEAVERSLKELGYSSERLPLDQDILDGMIRLRDLNSALVFNLCESFREESLSQMNIPGVLELMGIPYTGSGPLSIGLSQDKALTKDILTSHKIPVPAYQVISGSDFELSGALSFPLIVKPLFEDASLGIDNKAVVRSFEALERRIQYVVDKYRQPAIVEAFIEGREINVAIFGNTPATVLPLSEIDFSRFPSELYKICSYEAKWVKDSFEYQNTIPICPAVLPKEVEAQVQEIALRTYNVMGCRDYARVDMRLDAALNPYVIEVNTNPDISPEAGFARSILKSGRTYTEFINQLIEFVIARCKGNGPQ
jgi:D-alanine-D-alanine ligase